MEACCRVTFRGLNRHDPSQADEGYDNLHGVDYSETAIELSRQVAETEGYEGIAFSVLDLTDVEGLPAELVASFDLILDKGTFDAITLAQTRDGKTKPTTLWVLQGHLFERQTHFRS